MSTGKGNCLFDGLATLSLFLLNAVILRDPQVARAKWVDENGNHVYGVAYPFDSLTGSRSVSGQPVKCISVEWMVTFYSGYELDENDYLDVKALCQHYGIQLPSEFDEFEKRKKQEDEDER